MRSVCLAGLVCAVGVVAAASPPETSRRPAARPETLMAKAAETGVSAGASPGTPPRISSAASSPHPAPRPADLSLPAPSPAAELIEAAALSGRTGYVVADARTGTVLESRNPDLGRPAASVTKAVTALYALDTLGPGYRYRTRLLATGPVRDGRLEGDLILEGSGDPALDTDALGELAEKLKKAGIHDIAGAFEVYTGALPAIAEIDPRQPDHAGYNPAVSGLNLNFNRVHFAWERGSDGYEVALEARARHYTPRVSTAQMRVVDRLAPVYTFADGDGVDHWTVARGALGGDGQRWLPVHNPARYATDAFRTLARTHGLVLPEAEPVATLPEDTTMLAQHVGEPLREVLRGMLKYSTNLTAEVTGLTATRARGGTPGSLRASAARMNAWLREEFGVAKVRFTDHSGLGDRSRVSARALVSALVASGPDGPLAPILKKVPMLDRLGRLASGVTPKIRAKTGTLFFTSALAGFVTTPSGRELAFAVLSADPERRKGFTPKDGGHPPGARSWTRRARNLQMRLIERWSRAYRAG